MTIPAHPDRAGDGAVVDGASDGATVGRSLVAERCAAVDEGGFVGLVFDVLRANVAVAPGRPALGMRSAGLVLSVGTGDPRRLLDGVGARVGDTEAVGVLAAGVAGRAA